MLGAFTFGYGNSVMFAAWTHYTHGPLELTVPGEHIFNGGSVTRRTPC